MALHSAPRKNGRLWNVKDFLVLVASESVCVREREKERECLCVCLRERGRETGAKATKPHFSL